MNFPRNWPQGCPPGNTPDAAGEVYRIAKQNPVAASCMQSHHETGRLPTADPCLRCGLSVFRHEADAINQQNLMPRLGKIIARGTLLAQHGKACSTPGQQPSHTTWWPFEGVDRASLFSVSRVLP